MRFTLFTALAVAAVVSTSATRAEIINFNATLNGASETPANPSAGKGTASVALDTDAKHITWTVTYSGLSGPATTAQYPKGEIRGQLSQAKK